MTPEELLADPPPLHDDPSTGGLVDWGLAVPVLRRLGELAPAGRTLETGAGLSTLFFAASGCRHTAIAPDPQLFARLEEFAARHAIDWSHVELVAERSETELPRRDLGELDLLLIDGRHAFPSPFIDWYYGANAVKVGGYVAVDDTQLLTGEILAAFLADDVHWDDGEVVGRTAIFEKLDAGLHLDEWGAQPFLTRGRRLTGGRRLAFWRRR